MMTSEEKRLTVVEQKEVIFYGDELTAVLVREDNRTEIYVPVRPIADYLGLNWSGQYLRIQRDTILSEASKGVFVTQTPERGGRQEMVCLPLKFLPGWLFGVQVSRVREELQEKILRYQRECYDVLAEAFAEGRLTADPTFEALLESDSPAAQAYQMASAIMKMARQQLLLEGRVEDHEHRLEAIEATLGDPGRHVTPEQASQISQAVKAVAMKLGQKTNRNEYGGVYGELYRRYGITSYKQLPTGRFQEAMDWLTSWHDSLTSDVPF